MWIEYDDNPAFYATAPKKDTVSKASLDVWHRRVGRPSDDVLKQVKDHSTGGEMTSTERGICEPCQLSKASQQIPRRTMACGKAP
jgi:hypothetical protein